MEDVAKSGRGYHAGRAKQQPNHSRRITQNGVGVNYRLTDVSLLAAHIGCVRAIIKKARQEDVEKVNNEQGRPIYNQRFLSCN